MSPSDDRVLLQACFGIGSIIATGVFSFTGLIYSKTAGPAVVLSFLVAGAAAALSAACYAEFAVGQPFAGACMSRKPEAASQT